MPKLISRRKLILGLAAGTILTGCDNRVARHFIDAMGRWNEGVDRALFSSSRLAPEEPESALTPERSFPSYFVSDDMPIAPPDWVLKVGGLVSKPLVFTLDQLKRMPRADMRIRHHCVEGWSAVAGWHGVRVRDLARIAGASPETKYVEFSSFDSGYYSTWDVESAFHPQTLLAYGMNGRDLGAGHGAPLRLYSPVKLGYKNVKYLTEVNFLPTKAGGYWEDQGYDWYGGV